jgi:hypothetical protein
VAKNRVKKASFWDPLQILDPPFFRVFSVFDFIGSPIYCRLVDFSPFFTLEKTGALQAPFLGCFEFLEK